MTGRILAIDYGNKKTGLAVTDESQTIITTLPQIQNDPFFWKNLQDVLDTYAPAIIILGYPSTDYDELTGFQKNIIAFKKKLETMINSPVQLQDESFTSEDAEEIYVKTKGKKKTSSKKRKEKKQKIDSLAAHLLLKSYLNI